MQDNTDGSRRRLLRGLAGGLLLAPLARAIAADQPEGTVEIHNFTFKPPMLRVAPGTTVTWVNRDDIPHSIVLEALGVHSHAMDTDERFTFRFQQTGSFDYRCGLHPHMQGKVIVG